jgi:cysteine-S-conjugate beta-lyase
MTAAVHSMKAPRMTRRSDRSGKLKKETLVTTAGRNPEDNFGVVNPPVYHASTIIYPSVKVHDEARKNKLEGVQYGRIGTPTTFAFEEAVAALEGGTRSVSLCSGLNALTTCVLAVVKAGDHILVSDSCYGPMRTFCTGALARLGVETTFYDPLIGAGIAALMHANTKLVYTESPGSLTFEVQDVPAIAAAAHAHGALVMLDNSWSGGLYFQPFRHGVDLSVQAATKYLAGHSDAMLGTITSANDDVWRKVKTTAMELGLCAGPDDCYLGLRGIRTLAVRLKQHQENGLQLARWLQARPEVVRVIHPALPQDPGYRLWKRDFTGATGLFAIVLKPSYPKVAVDALIDALDLFGLGYSWGGFDSLITAPNPGALRSATKYEAGGPFIRLHVGLEDADDLIADLERGFAALAQAS